MSTLLKAVVGNIPDVMAELTREYIEKTDYNERAKIKMRMKSLLDLLSVDSSYPNNPAMTMPGEIPDDEAFNPAMLRPPLQQVPRGGLGDYMDGGMLAVPPAMRMGPGLRAAMPVPGAPVVNNNDFLR